MITIDDACRYLGIDYADDMITANLEMAIAAADGRLRGAVGEDVDCVLPGDPRVRQLQLIYTAEGYDLRADNGTGKIGSARAHLINDLEVQLRLEYSRALEEGGGA